MLSEKPTKFRIWVVGLLYELFELDLQHQVVFSDVAGLGLGSDCFEKKTPSAGESACSPLARGLSHALDGRFAPDPFACSTDSTPRSNRRACTGPRSCGLRWVPFAPLVSSYGGPLFRPSGDRFLSFSQKQNAIFGTLYTSSHSPSNHAGLVLSSDSLIT